MWPGSPRCVLTIITYTSEAFDRSSLMSPCSRSRGGRSPADQVLVCGPLSGVQSCTEAEVYVSLTIISRLCQVHVQGAGQINVAAALAATMRVTPAAITLCACVL